MNAADSLTADRFVLARVSCAMAGSAQEAASPPKDGTAAVATGAPKPGPVSAEVAGGKGELDGFANWDLVRSENIVELQSRLGGQGPRADARRLAAAPPPGDRAPHIPPEKAAFVELPNVQPEELAVGDGAPRLAAKSGIAATSDPAHQRAAFSTEINSASVSSLSFANRARAADPMFSEVEQRLPITKLPEVPQKRASGPARLEDCFIT